MIVNEILQGDALASLQTLPDESVDMCVTSPPYFGLRDYKAEGQIGLEDTPEKYVENLVKVFREVRRVLKKEGTCWVNLGDSYAANRGYQVPDNKSVDVGNSKSMKAKELGCKPKDLIGIPWMVAFALRADGWYLRQDIIWRKPNPMPESMTDRCTKSHEYIFLLAKSKKYYFDAEAIKEPSVDAESFKGRRFRGRVAIYDAGAMPGRPNTIHNGDNTLMGKTYETKNKRSVWTVTVNKPLKAAHFAMYPLELIRPCIKAGCPKGGIVLDPFMGGGTSAIVALQEDCQFLGCEINPDNVQIAYTWIASELERLIEAKAKEAS